MLDEVSYFISPEFFTKFRFAAYNYPNDILLWQVAFSGFQNALLIGLLIGLPLSGLTFFHKNINNAARYAVSSFGIIIVVTIIFAIIGYFSGKYLLTEDVVNWELPDSIIDKVTFLAIETMNNFTYMGATVGMLISIYWQMKRKSIDDKSTIANKSSLHGNKALYNNLINN